MSSKNGVLSGGICHLMLKVLLLGFKGFGKVSENHRASLSSPSYTSANSASRYGFLFHCPGIDRADDVGVGQGCVEEPVFFVRLGSPTVVASEAALTEVYIEEYPVCVVEYV